MRLHSAAVILLLTPLCSGEQIHGRVLDAVTGEALSRTVVSVQGSPARTVTDPEGRYTLSGLAPGLYVLRASTVGYRATNETVQLLAGVSLEKDILLSPVSLRQAVTVSASSGAFELESPMAVSLAGGELKNLASVLADDPLRAVQGMPGVTSNDDYQSQFALRGAGFHRIGLYLDGVLMHSPFHAVQGDQSSASLTIFNGDMLDSLELHAGPLPPALSDRTAGALEIRTREGDRRRFTGRATASASNVAAQLEGPLGRLRRGSWLVAARKSYLEYIIRRTAGDIPPLAFGFSDFQGRATYDVSRSSQLTVSLIQGFSGLDRSGARLSQNAIYFTDFDFTQSQIAWRFTPGSSTLLSNRVAFLRERYSNLNLERSPLGASGYGEWMASGDGAQMWAGSQELSFGWSLRRVRDDGYSNRYFFNPLTVRRLDEFRGHGLRPGAYLQQSVQTPGGRIVVHAGGRWDHHTINGVHAFSPYASAAFQLSPATRFSAAWGQTVQFAEIGQFYSFAGRTSLLPERATSVQASIEHRLGERTRLRLEAYNRTDRDLLFRPFLEPRIINQRVFHPSVDSPWENSLRGYARGAQIFLQRRTANGFTGWISYGYGVARMRDGVAGIRFPADYDQRHSASVYGSYRIRPTVNLSGRWVYGSGLPLPGFLRAAGGVYYLHEARNRLRLPAYQRVDARMNKVFVRDRWQLSLFVEVINVSNRDNYRFEEVAGYNTRTRVARVVIDKTLPIIPSAGILLQF